MVTWQSTEVGDAKECLCLPEKVEDNYFKVEDWEKFSKMHWEEAYSCSTFGREIESAV